MYNDLHMIPIVYRYVIILHISTSIMCGNRPHAGIPAGGALLPGGLEAGRIYIYIYIYIYIHTCVYVITIHVCVHIYIYICMSVCVHIYIYIEREREREAAAAAALSSAHEVILSLSFGNKHNKHMFKQIRTTT